jgi:hypothetical protein
MAVSNKFVYFLYSEEQLKERNEILSKQGKIFVPGTVYVGMSRLLFTQISEKDYIDRFIDTKVVAKGYKNQMKYDLPVNKKKEVE